MIFRAEPVGEPAAQCGATLNGAAAVHRVDGLAVIVHTGVHAADEAQLISHLAKAGHKFAEVHAGLAVLFELPFAGEHLAAGLRGVVVFNFFRKIASGPFVELGFGIADIHLARAALHEAGNHRLGLRLVMRLLGQQRVRGSGEVRLHRLSQKAFTLQQPSERHPTDSHRVLGKKMAPG